MFFNQAHGFQRNAQVQKSVSGHKISQLTEIKFYEEILEKGIFS